MGSGGRSPSATGEADPLRSLVVTAAGILGLVAALVWATGQLAGRIWGGGWPSVAPSDAVGVMFRLRGHLGDPARAWPPHARALLPDALYLYLTCMVLVVVVLVIVAWALSHWLARERRGDPDAPVSAAWATRRELQPLLVREPTAGRLTLGTAFGRLVAAERGQSVAVIGPTRSGKTTGLAIPAILEWQGPVIATSVKTDLVRDTIEEREHQGEVWVYDPTASTGLPGATWSPLAAADTWQGAQRVASWLASTVKDSGGGLTDGDFWYASAAKLLSPLLFAGATSGHTMADVVRWVDTQEQDQVREALERAEVAEALTAARASWNREPKQRSSVYTTAETVLAAYADPAVARSSRSSAIGPKHLLDGGSHTLYLCAPSDEQARLRPLFASLLQTMLGAVYKRSHSTGRPLDPPLLVVLDEAANIAPLRDLDTLASTAAGQGIQLMTVWQDLAQMRARYGDRAHTVLNNHQATMVLPGVKDPQTLEHVSRLIGDAAVTRRSTTQDASGKRSTTEGLDHRRLTPDHAIRGLAAGEALLVYGRLPAARLALRPLLRR